MIFVYKLLFLMLLLRFFFIWQKPWACAGIYAAFLLIINSLIISDIPELLIVTVIGFFLAVFYFWLLTLFRNGFRHWTILFGGIAFGLV